MQTDIKLNIVFNDTSWFRKITKISEAYEGWCLTRLKSTTVFII